jgi:hypothetical protein
MNLLSGPGVEAHPARPESESAIMLRYQCGILCAQSCDSIHPLICVQQSWIENGLVRDKPRHIIAAINVEVGCYVEMYQLANLLVLEIELLLRWESDD